MNLIESRTTLTLSYIFLGFAAFISLFPMVLMLLNSFKPAAEIIQNPLSWPEVFRWDNFTRAWQDANFSKTFLNSMILTIITIVLVCTTGSMTAYVLARKKVKSWRLLTGYLLATTTAPIQLFMCQVYY